MFDRSKKGDRAVLLCPQYLQGKTSFDEVGMIAEFKELARSAGAEVLTVMTSSRQRIDPKSYIGSGKATELAETVEQLNADLVLVDAPLSPIQERNLEKIVQARVLDRRTLILDIFAQRARSYEGQLQVELAQLKHMSTRLVRGWTHLERQKGGIGMRGPGETQLETDRRLLAIRVKTLNARLNKVLKQREQGRKQRKKSGVKMIALVGYTNAGKSTLFNLLTNSNVFASDQLFATLDPTIRQLPGIKGSKVVISDTVGFVRDLPHELVAAFRATLQEAVDADLLLHVIDDSNDEHREHIIEVNKVLQELKLDGVPMIEIYNKIDLSGSKAQTLAGEEGLTNKIWLSAHTEQGVDLLNKTIEERLNRTHLRMSFTLPLRYAQLRALFYQLDGIRSDAYIDSIGWQIEVELPLGKWLKLTKTEDANGHFLTQTLKKHNYSDESKTFDHTAIGEKHALE